MDKTTVLFITDSFYNLAGAERNIFEVLTRLNPQKYKPILICFMGGKAVDLLRSKGIEVYNLKLKKIYSPKAFIKALWIINFIKSRNTKIVVTYHKASDFYGGLIAKLAKVQVIISSRRDMGDMLANSDIFVYRAINGLFDTIVTVCDRVKNRVFQRENVLWHKLKTVYNGVELEKFSKPFNKTALKKSLGLEENRPIIGMLAMIRPEKGHKYFLEAASIVFRKYPDAYFLIVGAGSIREKYLLDELTEMSQKMNIEKNVIFTGLRIDTCEILSIMDISVLSSISNEGFSNSILESMAAGKPVVATDVGGSSELVVNRETGFIVSPRDAKALADAVLVLLANKQLAENMGKAGRERIEKSFSMSKMINEVEDLYGNLLLEKIDREKYIRHLNLKTAKRLFIKSIKISFSNFIYYSGLVYLIKNCLSFNRGLRILAYHRVSNHNCDNLGMNIRVDTFEKQIRYLCQHYKIVSLEKAAELLKNNTDIPNGTIVITFDDGYRDNYINAFPILKKYQVPATIFLTVGVIDNNQNLWFDKIIGAFKETKKKSLNLRKFNLREYLIDSEEEKMNALEEIIEHVKQMNSQDLNSFIKFLLNELDVSQADFSKHFSMLRWQDILEMKDNGIAFGSHGMNHLILSRSSKEEVEFEIIESKKIIERKTGLDIKLFAYPNGRESDFNEETMRLLEENDYIAACTLIKGANKKIHPFGLRRYCMSQNYISNLLGNFSKALFETHVSGILQILPHKNDNKHKRVLKKEVTDV